MATGRTVGASLLTEKDKSILELCNEITIIIKESISDVNQKKHFYENYGKISYTRDAGAGRGGGKLQRDALCVRGRQGKVPYSNRNLRWHPLVVASKPNPNATPIERISIEGEADTQTLIFHVDGESYYPEEVYRLNKRYVVLPEHWDSYILRLKLWNDTTWTQNSCIIPAMESCEWWQAVEVFALLGISVAVEYYNADFKTLHKAVCELLSNQKVDTSVKLPSTQFPVEEKYFVDCPVCLRKLNDDLSAFRKFKRRGTWQPAWSSSKREEGEDGSNQLLHLFPLNEEQIEHVVGKVKFGHRWCNVAMTDHSIDETLDFFNYVCNAHASKKVN